MSRTTKQPKTGGKAVSCHCQNNGSCSYCLSNRTISSQRQESKAVQALREYLRNAPQDLLDEDLAAIQAMDIQGPSLSEYLATNPVWQLHLAEQQLIVARNALKEIATWDQALQDTVVAYGSGTGVWLGCVTTANKAIQDMRNLKRK